LYDAIVEKKYPSRWSVLGIFGAFLGIILIINPTHFSPENHVGRSVFIGDAFALAGSIFNAGVYITLKKLRDSYDTVTVVFWSYAISATILVLPATPFMFTLSAKTIGLLCVMASLGLIGQTLTTLGFKFSSASLSAIFMLSIVPLTTASGILFFNEAYYLNTLLGMGLVTISLVVIAKFR
jgi:drug/metabolite transporter (DMT)-like permease